MAVLRKKNISASTLVETIVAFVVVITIFTFSLSLLLQMYSSFQKVSGFNSGYHLIEASWNEFACEPFFEKKTLSLKGWRIETDTVACGYSPNIYQIYCSAYSINANVVRKISLCRLRPCSENIDPLSP